MRKRTKVRVRYDGHAVRVGEYLPGTVYEVDPAEAERLIAVKGFTEVKDEGDEED
jgi:hypothetical protein